MGESAGDYEQQAERDAERESRGARHVRLGEHGRDRHGKDRGDPHGARLRAR